MIERVAILSAAVIVGVVLHELTHWVVASVLATRVRVDWRSLTVLSELTSDAGRWRDFAIGWSPVFVGLTLGVGALILGSAPPVSMETASLYLAWMSYSFGGDLDDYLARTVGDGPAYDEPWAEAMARKRAAFTSMVKLVSTGVLAAGGWLIWPVWWWLALGGAIAAGGVGYFAAELVAADPRSWEEVMHPRED
jgi:hypothetical protein